MAPRWTQSCTQVYKMHFKGHFGTKIIPTGSARLAGGGVRGGIVNYLQIFKEDICRYLKKISADSRKSAGICWKSICKGICREGYLQEKLRDQRTHLKRSSARGHRADLVWVPSSDLLKIDLFQSLDFLTNSFLT